MLNRLLPIAIAAAVALPASLLAQSVAPAAPAPAQPAPTAAAEPALAPAPAAPAPPPSVRNVPYAQFNSELPMIQRNVVQDCTGLLSGMAMDVQRNILYIAATGKGAIEVHDVATSKSLQSIGGLPRPVGLLHIASQKRLIASHANNGMVVVYAAGDNGLLSPERSVQFAGEAGPIVFDAAAQRCWVGHGVFVSCFDPATGTIDAEIQLGNSGRAVGLVLQSAANGKPARLLVALGGAQGEVAVIDPASRKLGERWKIDGAGGLSALALDAANNRVFAVSRLPAKLFVLDGATGQTVSSHDAPADPAGAWYDAVLRKVYVSGGGGSVSVFAQTGVNTYNKIHDETTDSAARTSLLVPEHRRLIVACPGIGAESARLFIYQIGQ